jgi:ABC-2 type transport system ATP-binding protein
MLIVENLVKRYNDTTAVDDISFLVKPGRIFGLLGPNGAGKTTTIRTVLNIIKPTSGKITFKDTPITSDFYNLIGYLPEERGLYKKSKVVDVLLYFAELKSLKKQDALKRIDEWLKRLSIAHYKDKKIEELSKGNQQKIQFISAVIHDPELLILDEPFTGFDPINQEEIKDLIVSFETTGKTIILSTHQMDTAEELCDEIFLMNNGKEVCNGTLSSIKKRFSGNNIKLQYSGDGGFIKKIPEVVEFDNYGNYAEVQLKEDVNPSSFLQIIAGKLDVKHFSVIEPTLNKIFLDVIKSNSN